MTAATIDTSTLCAVTFRSIPDRTVLYQSDRGPTLRTLARALKLAPPTEEICMCIGTLEIELTGANPSRVVLHHGTSLRWPGSPGNVPIADPDKLMNWLADHGMPFVRDAERDAERAARERATRHDLAVAAWKAGAPPPLRPLVEAMGPHGVTSAWTEVLAREIPDPVARAEALLAWFGASAGPWSGYPSQESATATMLSELPGDAIVEAIGWTTSPAASLGALRLLRSQKPGTAERWLARLPDDVVARLERNASSLLGPDHRASIEAMLDRLAKRTASRIPKSERAVGPDLHLPLQIVPRQGVLAGSIDAALRAIQERVRNFLATYIDGTRDHLGAIAASFFRHGGAAFAPDGLRFRSGGGQCRQTIMHRWFRIAIAADDGIEPMLASLGVDLIGYPKLRDVLEEPRAALLLSRGSAWLVTGSAADPQLIGDRRTRSPGDDERVTVCGMLDSRATADPVENLVRPDPVSGARYAQMLRDQGQTFFDVQRLASRCAFPSDDLIDALIMSSVRLANADALVLAARVASRAVVADVAVRYLDHQDASLRAVALTMMARQAAQDLVPKSRVTGWLLDGLTRSTAEQIAAAGELGHVALPGDAARVMAALDELLAGEAYPQSTLVEASLLSLVNLRIPIVLSERARATIEREAQRGTKPADFARWFLAKHMQ